MELEPRQRAVMEKVIADEERQRRPVVVALSGAHAYGFPSPDSDLDLKAIHIAKTADLLTSQTDNQSIIQTEQNTGILDSPLVQK